MISHNHKDGEVTERFDEKRFEEIARDIKHNRFPNGSYSYLEEKLWLLMDSVMEDGYDRCMRLHRLDEKGDEKHG